MQPQAGERSTRQRRPNPTTIFLAGRRAIVPRWTGDEVWRLRTAKRMSVRGFAAWLGVSDRMVSKWEAGTVPGPINQAALDTAAADVHRRRSHPLPPMPEPTRSARTRGRTALRVHTYGRQAGGRFRRSVAGRVVGGPGHASSAARSRHRLPIQGAQNHQVSQRTIARMVGMQQSEISEILAGRRVRQYDALLRICVGLRIPRHLMGLSDTEAPTGADTSTDRRL
jgi:transcriptional regulator with XRE-family HTH domain